MGGGWIGYLYVFAGCGVLLGVVGGSTLLLYLVARVRARRSPEPAVSVSSVSSRPDDGPGAV
jgi:hypothetical protein